jgi:hypothetical protein
MSRTLTIHGQCIALTLSAGAQLLCREGGLWVTMEGRRPCRSPDIVLAAGQRHRVTEDARYFLTALPPDRVTVCRICDVGTNAAPESPRRMGWLRALLRVRQPS